MTLARKEKWLGHPPLKPIATIRLKAKIFDNSEIAVVFSQRMEETFKKTGIELGDDETFACLIGVVENPTYISEVMDPTPEPSLISLMTYSDLHRMIYHLGCFPHQRGPLIVLKIPIVNRFQFPGN